MATPAGTVSSSEPEATCAVDGCTQSVVPGSQYCGLEDHGGSSSGAAQTDGTASPANQNVTGYSDGTGRSQAPDTLEARADESLSFGDQQSNVYAALVEFLSAAGGYTDIWVVDLSADWVVWEAWGPGDVSFWKINYTAGDDGVVTFSGAPQEVTITVKTSYDPVSREDESPEETRDVDAQTSVEPDEVPDNPAPETESAPEVPESASEPEEVTSEDEPVSENDEARAALAAARAGRRWKPRKRSTPDPRQEVRLRVSDLEIRAGTGDDEIVLEGTPIVYNTPYDVHDMFGTFEETMSSSVCDAVLARGTLDCRYLFNHDGLPLARTQSGTLELVNGSRGLKSIAHLDARQQLANDLAVAVERGDVSQMSCGFIVSDDEWDDSYMHRTVRSFGDLLDVSPVTYPASPTTSVALATRAMFEIPTETRARIREAFKVVNEVRAGKVLSQNNAQLIMKALESLHQADDANPEEIATRLQSIADAHDTALTSLSGVTGLEPSSESDGANGGVPETDPGEGVREDESTDEEVREQELEKERAAELRRKSLIARRDRLSRRRFLAV